MKVVLQRVKEAAVSTGGEVVGQIGQGLCLLVGMEKGDTEDRVRNMAAKIIELRIFPDEKDRMNRSLLDIKGEVLAVSQFTLAGSVKKGRRPSFDGAELPERAKVLFDRFVEMLREMGVVVQTGLFGAMMEVRLVNDGPVTFVIEK
jgi:D-tyrosyl-tRNA(Tyr) deacylase